MAGYFTSEQLEQLETLGRPSRVVERVIGDFLAMHRVREMAQQLGEKDISKKVVVPSDR